MEYINPRPKSITFQGKTLFGTAAHRALKIIRFVNKFS